ncbi:MAG TPA: type IV pilus assembly protein PilM [Candidatus Tyrphobacter sp.]|nr:type IV pilus assembly protein PilM [Candidatus Tyrphobacter sp.]
MNQFFKSLNLNSLGKMFRRFSQGGYLGVDIGTASIKMVELGPPLAGRPILRNYGLLENQAHLERLNAAIQTSSLKLVEKDTADLLSALLHQFNPKTKEVVASLPSFSAFTSLLDLPEIPDEELAQTMRYQAKTFIPLPLSEVAIDWIKTGEYVDEKGLKKQQVFLISVPQEVIKKYEAVFKAAGLHLIALEVEGLSLARVLTQGDSVQTLIIDIGARSTAILVAQNGFLKYSAQTDFAGGSLTQSVARGLGISVRRAEGLKLQKGLLGQGGEYGLSTLMLPFLDVIIGEAKRAVNIYEKNYGGKIERVILSGGGANLLGLDRYVSQIFNLPAVKADPWRFINFPPETAPLLSNLGAPLAVALGAALREQTGT